MSKFGIAVYEILIRERWKGSKMLELARMVQGQAVWTGQAFLSEIYQCTHKPVEQGIEHGCNAFNVRDHSDF